MKIPEIKIGAHRIGGDNPAFLIAEAGVNHNGSLDLARQLVTEARKAGAGAVKFQTFEAAKLVTAGAQKAKYQVETTGEGGAQFEMLKKLELPAEAFHELAQFAKSEGIEFLSTPYGPDDVDLLDSIGVSAFKIASAMLVEPPFLRHVASKGKPVILSAGMATHAEVAEAIDAVRSTGNENVIVLQCTTNYPASVRAANLRAMVTIRDAFQCVAGYSDHTQDHRTALLAVALGTSVIEKHFTLSKSMPGPDHSSSCSPEEFAELVRWVRDAEAALGSGRIAPREEEIVNLQQMRRSLVTSGAVAAGERLTLKNVTLKRPATGIAPRELEAVLTCRAKRDLPADTVLQWAMLDHDPDTAT